MRISDLMVSENILINLSVSSKTSLFEKMSSTLNENGYISNEKKFLKDLFKREKEFSTGIGDGFAIPHAKSKYVKKATIAVAKLAQPIGDYETLDNKPVKWVFMLAIPLKDSEKHLEILSFLARKMMDDSFKKQIEQVQNKDEFLKIMDNEEVIS